MSLSVLRAFYDRAGRMVAPANDLRLAAKSQDLAQCIVAAKAYVLAAISWCNEIEAVKEYEEQHKEWNFKQAEWRHGGESGPMELAPPWPSAIPEIYEALDLISAMGLVLEVARGIQTNNRVPIAAQVGCYVTEVIGPLNTIRALLDAEEEPDDETDGPIDRNVLAHLVGVKSKTLANRAEELPLPLARDSHNVPIYRYRPARLALLKMYPDRHFMLPEKYREAIAIPRP